MNNDKNSLAVFLDYVSKAPIITFPGYEDSITTNIKSNVRLYRLAGQKDIENKMAINYEVAIYLSTVSFETLLSSSWQKIYFHALSKYQNIDEGFLRKLQLDEEKDLQDLKYWIYKKQLKRMKHNS